MTFGAIGRVPIGHIAASRHRVGLTPELARTERHPVAKVIDGPPVRRVYDQHGQCVTRPEATAGAARRFTR
jgi:hypothetical protein